MKNVSFFDFAREGEKKGEKENWMLMKIKENARNVESNYLLWSNVSMAKNIGTVV